MGRNIKFPRPKDCKVSDKAILCPAERVIDLYNQNSGESARRISKKVRDWFAKEARNKSWAGVHFLKEVQSNHGAGCILWRRPANVGDSVEITERILLIRST